MDTKQWYVYILTNHTNSVLYVGITNDLHRRTYEHKSIAGKSTFTGRYKVYKLVWFEEFTTPTEAILTEKRIKGWRREKKINLIIEKNPQMNDLARLE